MPQPVRWVFVSIWLVFLLGGVGVLAGQVGSSLALLLTLIILAPAQLVHGLLCRWVGKSFARRTYLGIGLLLLPATVLLPGAAGDLTTVAVYALQLVAWLNWSDDDIGGWGRRRWAQMRAVVKVFSVPVMGGLPARP